MIGFTGRLSRVVVAAGMLTFITNCTYLPSASQEEAPRPVLSDRSSSPAPHPLVTAAPRPGEAPASLVKADPVPATGEPSPEQRRKILESYGRLPLSFIENRGQVDGPIAYYLERPGHSVYFGAEALYLRLTQGTGEDAKAHTLKVELLDADPATRIEALEPAPGIVSYFKGPKDQWKTAIPTTAKIGYRRPWPGIDLQYQGAGGTLETVYTVAPRADPAHIKLRYSGQESLTLDEQGNLVIETSLGEIKESAPVLYQEIEGRRIEIEGAFTLLDERTVGFTVAAYDRAHPLIIDPTLVYAGYIGGLGSDQGSQGIAVDSAGNAYVTGRTASTEATFPVSVGPDPTFNGGEDAFVAKVKADGSGLEYAGYIGGSGGDIGLGIAVDSAGNAYVTGITDSSETTFPVTVGPDLTFNGFVDAFVAKVKADGSALEYAGYIGGSGGDIGLGIAVDSAGNAYVAGRTPSSEATFPVSVGPDPTFNGGEDAFVAKVKADGSGLEYAGYIGGSDFDQGLGIAVDSAGNAYVTGDASSTEATFPVIVGPDLALSGGGDAFVAKVKADGSGLEYAGYIGGSGGEEGLGIAVDSTGNAYVVGTTNSTEATFPVTVGPDVTFNGGSNDTFVAKVKADGSGLEYAGYIGGSDIDGGSGIAVDSLGNAYVTGVTSSTEATFPVTVGPDLTFNGFVDAFVAKVKADGSGLEYAGYIGGSDFDGGSGIAVDPAGNAYVNGQTISTEATFPVSVGPDLTFNGGVDAFVAKIGPPALTSITVTPANPAITVGQTQPFTATGTFSDGSTQVLTAGGGTWTTKTPMSTARDGPGVGVVNGILYAVGGGGASGTVVATVEAYDPVTNTWATKAPMPIVQWVLDTGVVNGILYTVGGSSSTPGTVYAYDPATNTWTTKAPMPTARWELGVGVVNGILYAVGGHNDTTQFATVEAYDPATNTWTTKAPMLTAQGTIAGVGVVNDILYAVASSGFNGGPGLVEAYDPATNTWTTKASIPDSWGGSTVGVVNGILYAVGGSNGVMAVPVEAYDPATNTWTNNISMMPTTRTYPAVGVVNGILYAVGGRDTSSTVLATVEAYTPSEVTWSSSNGSVAPIDQTGLATGLSPGTTTITATSGSISGSTTLTVVSPTFTLSVSKTGTGGGAVTSSPAGINCGATCAASYAGGTVVTLTATPDATSTFTGWGGACSGIAGCTVTMNSATSVTATFTSRAADLAVTKTDSPDPVTVNTSMTYTMLVTNNGPSRATGVRLTDPMPSNVTFVSAASSRGSCSEAAGTVTCTIGRLGNGRSATVTIIVTPTAVGPLTNTACVTGNEPDPNSTNDCATAPTTVNAPTINTPAGSGVSVPLGSGLTVTFGTVSTAGETTLTIVTSGPPPPTSFRLGTLQVYYDLNTTATFSGPITICFTYDDSQFSRENRLKLFHHSGATWTNVTTSLDTTGNVICGTTTSLSPFVVVEPDLADLINISTRARVLTGDNVQIGGFIIGGSVPKTVLIRARGPSMSGAPFNVPGTLANPFVQLYSFATGTFFAQNDNWQTTDPLCGSPAEDCGDPSQIVATGLDPCRPNPQQITPLPGCSQEAALLITIPPGNYGAIVSGVGGGTGVGLVEVFEMDTSTAILGNISTRVRVETGDNVEIGGFIIQGSSPKQVLIRARGPSMGGAPFNVPATLANPFVQLYSFATGTFIAQNDNWQVSDPLCAASGLVCGGSTEISATGLDPCLPNPGQIVAPPGCAQESAILITLPPGNYGAIVSGVSGGTGVGLVEVFEVP